MRQSTIKRDRKAVRSAVLEAARETVPEATLDIVNKYRMVAGVALWIAGAAVGVAIGAIILGVML